MATIEFTIPIDKLDRVKAGFLEFHPNNTPGMTDNQWMKERIMSFIIDSVKQGESMIAQRAAIEALPETDSLVS